MDKIVMILVEDLMTKLRERGYDFKAEQTFNYPDGEVTAITLRLIRRLD